MSSFAPAAGAAPAAGHAVPRAASAVTRDAAPEAVRDPAPAVARDAAPETSARADDLRSDDLRSDERARPPLRRPRACAVTGVSAGLARHLGAPVWAVRALFVVLAPFGGAGVLFYLWCWAFMPWESGDPAPTRRAPVAWMLLVVALATFLLPMPAFGDLLWRLGYDAPSQALGIVVAVVLPCLAATASGLWAAVIDRADPARGPRHAAIVRVVAVVLLAVQLTILMLLLQGGGGIVGMLLPLLPLGGVVVVLSASLVRRWRELSGERVKRIREEQRAEMAAHLHDSVLQTLALIQNRAGASSEAARLARAQERELRAWLYDGDAPADSDLATDLRDYAGALELDYPVRIEVVSAGLSTERASGEVAAAAREAMLNAARHAGGDVSVYIEGRGDGVEVFVRDRGGGFDPDDLPSDRLGVRESIVGRMRRVGGSAEIRSGASGTEVQLRLIGGAA
ncbi:ATP-binding protein [Microbacterium sp. No. 7]|uniref:ATP-binding protein n=1 Tax=Microbacterium sp. No. 7 TaxID=1714373 RepID=UPI0006D020D3|nr:ATP-binding protein [Microbacterium sp. No. 7]ALJ19157.1 hypothetical protein AOA12_04260 [Microbacterium sp. No. 7]